MTEALQVLKPDNSHVGTDDAAKYVSAGYCCNCGTWGSALVCETCGYDFNADADEDVFSG